MQDEMGRKRRNGGPWKGCTHATEGGLRQEGYTRRRVLARNDRCICPAKEDCDCGERVLIDYKKGMMK